MLIVFQYIERNDLDLVLISTIVSILYIMIRCWEKEKNIDRFVYNVLGM